MPALLCIYGFCSLLHGYFYFCLLNFFIISTIAFLGKMSLGYNYSEPNNVSFSYLTPKFLCFKIIFE